MKKDILSFVKRRSVALIGSIDKSGFPNIKAMLAPRKIDGNTLYFSTNTSSMRVGQFLHNDKACVYFFKKGVFRYTGIMLVGTMEVLTDEKSKKDIWRTGDTVFYKQGVADPDYCVLKFKAETCRFYRDLKTENIDI